MSLKTCIYLLVVSLCCASSVAAQPIVLTPSSSPPSLSDVNNIIPDPIYSQFPPGAPNSRGYVTLPDDVVCMLGSRGWNPEWPQLATIEPPEPKGNTQLITCFFSPIDGAYYDNHISHTKQWIDYVCTLPNPNVSPFGQYCDYFNQYGWIGIHLDRVAGFGNQISAPPGSAALQHYQSVGAISPSGTMRLRASVATPVFLSSISGTYVRNMRYRISGLNDEYIEVPILPSEVSTYQIGGVDRNYLDYRLIDVELPTSLFECHASTFVSAAIDISVYTEIWDDNNDVWVSVCLGVWTIVDWIAIDWEEVAPVVLVHGISQNSSFWDFTDFLGVVNPPLTFPPNSLNNGNDHGLAYWIPQGLIWDLIDLRPDLGGGGTVAENAADFSSKLEEAAFYLGTDRVHVVAHSKGGLDMRGFLSDQALYNESDPDQTKVLSLHTLSTPHEGSILADVKRGIINELDDASNNIGIGDAAITDALAAIWKTMRQPGEGYNNLTTRWCSDFRSTIKDMPKECVYTTYGDDADIFKNYSIEANEIPNLLDFARSRGDFWDTQEGLLGANFAYQRLGTTRHYRVGRETVWVDRPLIGPRQVDRLRVSDIEQFVFRDNDLLVTEISAWGYGGFSSKDYNRGFSVLSGQGHSPAEWGYNGGQTVYGTHIDVADILVGRNSHIGPSIIAADKKYGFLKE